MSSALVCGAGKIGRGFLGQLVVRSGFELYFADSDARLVALLNERRSYRVEVCGRPDLSEKVSLERAVLTTSAKQLQVLAREVDVVLIAVGARNLESVATSLGQAFRDRVRPINWILCENLPHAASVVRRVLETTLEPSAPLLLPGRLGLVETQVLRSGMDPATHALDEDPLAVRASDWWTLPADADAFVGSVPAIDGLEPRPNFSHELVRKLYTFNGLNGPLAYVGHARGYRLLHEAARAPELDAFVRSIQQESGHGLEQEFGFDHEEHCVFQASALQKYRNPSLEDSLERNARDSARKLGLGERLIGPASLCLKFGREPHAYARAAAAAIDYRAEDDPGTRRVEVLLEAKGVKAVLEEICGLPPGSRLADLIETAWTEKTYRR